MTDSSRRLSIVAFSWCFLLCAGARAQENAPPPGFDFTQASTVAAWSAAHDVVDRRATAEGMEIVASGDDPFLLGPPVDLPENASLALEMKIRSEHAGTVEVFYFTDHATAGKSVTAHVAPGVWVQLRMPLPPLGERIRFRIDPPTRTGGRATIASMALRRRVLWKEPQWSDSPVAPMRNGPLPVLRSGELSLTHGGAPAGIEVKVGDRLVAAGLSRSFIGYTIGDDARWLPIRESADVREAPGVIHESFSCRDPDGATWRIDRRYGAGRIEGAIDVKTTVLVDRDRELLFFPALVLLPGAGSFGVAKSQGLFGGLEYLGPHDLSGSEADVIGPAAVRSVPDSLKVTVPLMCVCTDGNYVALTWEPNPAASPVFDSPDRSFGSRGHVMGLLLPGSDGRNRVDGSLLPEVPHRLRAGEPVTVRATILGGKGRSVVPALKQYVALRGLPTTPATGMDAQGYYRFAAGGWLDSKIREGNLVRHAVWPGFGAQRAADAVVWMRWLAAQTRDADLAKRLDEAATSVAAAVPPEHFDSAAVSHVRYPVASLVLGKVEENAKRAAERGTELLSRFEPDASVRFRREAGKEDFARTNPTPTSNGLTATYVVRVLEAAAVSGDPELLRRGIELLRGLDRYEHDVPRGAQSWEVPLHTPDVLASAWLVRAYVWGYELTGERRFLELAQYWAWTGVPFVYLRNPADAPVGTYATIAVYGATNWVAPVWFGQPVQWCGLVYADALYRLSKHDSAGPWEQIADGITASGLQQSWPVSDRERQGLLPDFYHLRAQISDGPAINPGTLQANAVRLFGGPPVYDFCRSPRHGLLVHAPGALELIEETKDAVRLRVIGWPREPYHVLVAGIGERPRVTLNGQPAVAGDVEYYGDSKRLVLNVNGTASVEIRLR